jgi:phospholipid/cholesterol/gamma-HCH transport system ATP-binding protein
MSSEKLIDIKGLSATIDNRKILSDISFHVDHGEILVILGSSGSGKTTLLKHMLGLYPSDEESVTVLGKNPSLLDEDEEIRFYKQLGVFFQDGALLNSMTVGENIALPLEQHTNLPATLIQKIVSLKLQLVNLEGCYHLFPKQLSGGMLKRAALARAIVLDPELLFCDEPGAGLDPVAMASLDDLIINLKKLLGMTVVMVTHEVASILRIADRIIFLEKGRIIFTGTINEALKSNNLTVKEFFAKGRGGA